LDRGYLAPDGAIWLNGGGTFQRWDHGKLERQAPPDELVQRGYRFSVNTAAWDRQGRLWASVSGIGQFYLKDSRWTFVPILPGRADLTAAKAHVDAEDRVWLAYVTEVARVHQDTVRVFSQADGLALGPILALTSRDASLWLGAEMGLAFEKNDRFHAVRTHDGREFGGVADIVPTRDGLWLSAANGIVHIPDSEVRRVTNDPSHRVLYDLFDLVSDLHSVVPHEHRNRQGRSPSDRPQRRRPACRDPRDLWRRQGLPAGQRDVLAAVDADAAD
jgi:ligand-binding sensor domain-containing protein